MKIRIKFEKLGIMKYIGHLDIHRYFQKAMRRAGIDMKYTEGFSPHPVLSFASPLGIGLTTRGDYFDIELESAVYADTIVKRLNAQMADGMRVLSAVEIEAGKKSNAMASLRACAYDVKLGSELIELLGGNKTVSERWAAFLMLPEIKIMHETKSGVSEADIRPLILDSEYCDGVFKLVLCAGSAQNLRPAAMMTAFLSFLGTDKDGEDLFKCGDIEIERLEMYTTDAEEKLISLEQAGRHIPQV